ncbi:MULTISPECIES: rnhA operon protein [unclassified Haladaptatus]|uniref:DUF7108 family protein n=1 Tax=unclassified Haladaptatus TaxID=2622732 RepID=UPI00209BE319|nr:MULTISPECIES: rnhA operon protein [unclassified Haladaptatus]MCO8245095.1 rnhA operon protein [Haladaptatus sp. AB643]MCO8253238.1 rnhA operon protein [Haladaptatus sp. AB618]
MADRPDDERLNDGLPDDKQLDDERPEDEQLDDGLPNDAVSEAERLTHLARDREDTGAETEAEEYRAERERLLAEHGFVSRIREESARTVLVLHPDEWVEDGTIRVERIEDTDRAVEIPLTGAGDPDDWDEIDEHNRAVVERVRDEHGDVHGANAEAFADFMGNHYARPVESATRNEVAEFLNDYFPRNAWPTGEQKKTVNESVELVFDCVSRTSR